MKKKKASEKQSVGFYVRFTPAEAKRYIALAKKWKCSLAEVVRKLVENA